jgi:hypothetical protein
MDIDAEAVTTGIISSSVPRAAEDHGVADVDEETRKIGMKGWRE